jgi:hypothetical protein
VALVDIAIGRLDSLVLDEVDLRPLLFLLRVVDAGQRAFSRACSRERERGIRTSGL